MLVSFKYLSTSTQSSKQTPRATGNRNQVIQPKQSQTVQLGKGHSDLIEGIKVLTQKVDTSIKTIKKNQSPKRILSPRNKGIESPNYI